MSTIVINVIPYVTFIIGLLGSFGIFIFIYLALLYQYYTYLYIYNYERNRILRVPKQTIGLAVFKTLNHTQTTIHRFIIGFLFLFRVTLLYMFRVHTHTSARIMMYLRSADTVSWVIYQVINVVLRMYCLHFYFTFFFWLYALYFG
jgi:hypothetical protein